MSQNYNLINGKFEHILLNGSSYEIGETQGRLIRESNKIISPIIASIKLNTKKLGFNSLRELEAFYEENCPGINEEIQGFADGLNIPKETVYYYALSYSKPTACSQFVILSPGTENKHAYAGRSYEWIHTDEDLRLVTTKVKGKYAHIGFSGYLFGRNEGINEFGLTVTHSGAGIFDRSIKTKGVKFWVTIRMLLENCNTTEEAKKLLKKLEISEFFSLIITDRNENALLFETADGVYDYIEINKNSKEKFFLGTNHFQLAKTRKYNKLNVGIIQDSKERSKLIKSTFNSTNYPLTHETIKNLLAKKSPYGLCYHYYSQMFGTLWSMLFDITAKNVEVCFGAPTHNTWSTFDFKTSYNIKEFTAIFPDII